MTVQKIRAGVVGCGHLGRHHARILTEIEGVDPVGFVEPDDRAAAEIEKAHGAKGMVRRASVKALLEAGATAVVRAVDGVVDLAVGSAGGKGRALPLRKDPRRVRGV